MNKTLLYLERKLAAGLLRLIAKSYRFEVQNYYPVEQRCIFMFWHRNLMLLMVHRMDQQNAVLISSSNDGELIAGPARELGYITIRGSSTRGGTKALREMIEISKQHSIGITPDGPKGPLKSIHPGVYQVAYQVKIPIVQIAANTKSEWLFNSWDKFRFPKPFARIKVVYGEPIYVCTKEDLIDIENRLLAAMNALEEKVVFE
ncbi:MAG: hypothetical protein CVU48_06130 [Candidatus Cloacimonetes bacterium HGW-Cloacimonetes-1]|jgi:hypothetical protein|nr:MAG: hypothetical protein CVU48_06130 [Candidatus Cloacimonetes bacterium HGW-Cloacimonetes-1]